jgi:hypothetical protein
MYAKNNRRKNFMNKMKKLLSVVLAVVLAFSAFSVLGSAAKTAYKTVDELKALDAYSPYGQVTRLSTEERTSILFDALDNLLPGLNINMGEVFNVLGLSVTIDLTSIDRLCYSFDTIKDTFTNGLAELAMGIVNLGILESLNVDTWATGMTRDKTAQHTILSELLEFLSANTTLVDKEDDENEVALDENGSPVAENVELAEGEVTQENANNDTPPAQNEVNPEE